MDFGPPESYALGFPNTEVAQSLAQMFLESSEAGINPLANAHIIDIGKALDAGDGPGVEAALSALYASIPHQLHLPYEAFYHAIFLATMQFLGFRVLGEVSVAGGRADGVLERPNGMTWVLEFKYVKEADELEAAVGKALAQIEDRAYARRYAGSRRTVVRAAICVAARGQVRVESR